MDLVKLGRGGQVSLPRALLRRLGIEESGYFAADATSDGAITVRPVGIYPVEIYSEARVAEFMSQDEATAEERGRVRTRLDPALS